MKYVFFSVLTCLGIGGTCVIMSYAHDEQKPLHENCEQTVKNLMHPIQTTKYIFNE